MDPAGLPERGNLMLLMAILPMMLVGTIVVVTELDSRGLLGPPRRKVSLHAPLAAITVGLALGAAALHLAKLAGPAEDAVSLVLLAGVCFQIGWSLVHLRARNAWSATVGMLAAAVVLAVFVISHGLAGASAEGRASGLSDVFVVAYEIALILALVPQVAPSLAARLAAREMRVQRATVLAGFCIAVTVLFASLAVVG